MNRAMIDVRNVTKNVRGRTLINEFTFKVEQGSICGFIGPNGAGKTTLIRMLTGLVTPTAGEIVFDGIHLFKERNRALSKIGAIVESPIFFPYMSGRMNLRNLARLHPELSKEEQIAQVEEVLHIVGLQHRGKDKVGTYSLGMKQRLGIAQALLGQPSLIILDEPANGLDPTGMRELRELILRLRDEKGMTFFISSHLLDELQRICDRFVIIKEGCLVWQGAKEELANNYEGLEDAYVELMKD